jgi:hypothetical protein
MLIRKINKLLQGIRREVVEVYRLYIWYIYREAENN